jgi:hypothetical protein
MEDIPSRVVYAVTTLISAGVAALYLPWWGPVVILAFGIVLTINPKWGGDDSWPF